MSGIHTCMTIWLGISDTQLTFQRTDEQPLFRKWQKPNVTSTVKSLLCAWNCYLHPSYPFPLLKNKNAYRHRIPFCDYMFGVTGKCIYLTASLGSDSGMGRVKSKIKAAQKFPKYILVLTFSEIVNFFSGYGSFGSHFFKLFCETDHGFLVEYCWGEGQNNIPVKNRGGGSVTTDNGTPLAPLCF